MTGCPGALLLTLMAATTLSAQSPARPAINAARSGNWYLRVITSNGDTVTGRLTALRGDTARTNRAAFAVSDVVSMDRRIRRGGGAVPAGIFGAIVFGTVGVGVAGLCESDCEHAALIAAGGGAAMGLAMGTVVGALVAPGRPEWRRLHPPLDSAQARTRASANIDNAYAGGGVTLSLGGGWAIDEYASRFFRMAIQLAGTSTAARPVETTGEFQLIGIPDGGAAFMAGAGANVMLKRGSYVGPVVGVWLVDNILLSIGARAGIRPAASGLRPELRADYVVQPGTLLLSVSIGLELH